MKRTMFLFLVLIILAAFYVFSRHSGAHSSKATGSFQVFDSTPPILNIRFEYPPSWRLSVSRARKTEEETVQLLGPRDMRRQFSASIFVIAKKPKDPLDLNKAFEGILERNKQADQFRVISQKNLVLSGEKAREVIFEFAMDLPFDAAHPLTTMIQEQVIVAIHSGLVYQVHFIGTREQHRANGYVFRDFLRSFRFKK